jgi:hypothetical protein
MKLFPLILAAAVFASSVGGVMAEDNLFSDDLSLWTLKSSGEVSALSSLTTEEGKNALSVEITDIPESPTKVSDVRISQPFGDLNSDQTYQINFQAKADQPGKIVIFVYPENDQQRVLFRRDITVDSDWKDYTISFVAKEATSHCVLGFAGLGRTNNRYFFRPISE